MTKTISTLVQDMYKVLEDTGGWDAAISRFMSDEMHDLLQRRFDSEAEEREPTLRMSNLGTPCKRKLWYSIHNANEGEPLPPQARLKFLYGDILEILLLSLAKAAGHKVEGCQDTLQIDGIVGHRDAVIDGITVDVKSASPRSFEKFKSGSLRSNDPFGYVSQLSSYVYAGRDSDVESHPTLGAFLVVDKVSGELCLDLYDFSAEIETKLEEVHSLKETVNNADVIPDRAFEEEDDGYYNSKKKQFVANGNKKLGLNCSYCEFKKQCWPGLRTFIYGNGAPKFMTKVVKTPNVMEVT